MSFRRSYSATFTVTAGSQADADDQFSQIGDRRFEQGQIRQRTDIAGRTKDLLRSFGITMRSDCTPSNEALTEVMYAVIDHAIASGVHPINFIPDEGDWPEIPWETKPEAAT